MRLGRPSSLLRGLFMNDHCQASTVVQRIALADGLVLEVASQCDIGCVRKNNEDRVGVLALPEGAVLMVADGMGGHAAGEVASEIAWDTVRAACANGWEPPVADMLWQMLQEANQRIYAQGEANALQHGMGTTATVLALAGAEAWYAHVGDSRLYLLRERRLQQLSEDHSMVAEMVRNGMLNADAAADHPCRNVILRALGSAAVPEFQISPLPLAIQAGDVFLLCSDGLYEVLSTRELAGLLAAPAARACREMVDSARERGGPDNISAVVARVVDAVGPQGV